MASEESGRSGVRWRVPVGLAVLSLIGLNAHQLWHWADFTPTYIDLMAQIGISTALLCWVALLVWFVVLSGFSWKTRGLVVLLVAGGLTAFFFAVDEWTPSSTLFPSPRFVWQEKPEARLANRLAQQTADGLPPIDLTVEPVRDFPRYRGLRADGVVQPTDLLDLQWASGPPVQRWRHPCGGGFAGFAVAGNVLVTVEQRKKQEVVVCYDQATAQQRWTYAYEASFEHLTGSGPRATPAIVDGEVYSLGAMGDLVCLDGSTGALKWKVNVLQDNEAKIITWAMTSSPLVVENLVYVNAGVDETNNVGRALVAYDRKTGKRVWGAGSHRAGYSSPHFATLAGTPQVLLFDGGGLAGFNSKTGTELWRYPWETYQDMNIIQPLLVGEDRVFLSSETSNGGVMLKISRKGGEFSATEVWETKYLAAKQASPVKVGRAIYGLHNGTLVCLDVATGKRFWRGKTYGQGQILAVKDALLIQSEQGQLALVPADTTGFRELGRVDVFGGHRTWNTPALVGRYLYLRNDVEMVCYEWPTRKE